MSINTGVFQQIQANPICSLYNPLLASIHKRSIENNSGENWHQKHAHKCHRIHKCWTTMMDWFHFIHTGKSSPISLKKSSVKTSIRPLSKIIVCETSPQQEMTTQNIVKNLKYSH